MSADLRPQPSSRHDLMRLTARLVCEVIPDHPADDYVMVTPADLACLVGRAWMMGAETVLQTVAGERACRICGCTATRACNPPCCWVASDLCSACLPRV